MTAILNSLREQYPGAPEVVTSNKNEFYTVKHETFLKYSTGSNGKETVEERCDFVIKVPDTSGLKKSKDSESIKILIIIFKLMAILAIIAGITLLLNHKFHFLK